MQTKPEVRRPEPRVTTIEGRRVLVVERRPPLPRVLSELLNAPGMRVYPIRIQGWRGECSQQEHRLKLTAEGHYRCLDGVVRDLRVYTCADCEASCVRDVSIDALDARAPRFLRPRRVDHVLGWYSGSRRNQRVYHLPK
jgi:hypothetical protein